MGGANGEVATQHQKFLKLAATGVNVFVSSGDAGSNPNTRWAKLPVRFRRNMPLPTPQSSQSGEQV